MRREGEATMLSHMLEVATRTALLSAEEETALARAALAGSQAAFDRLLTAHLRLVLSIAHSLRKYGLPMEDLVGEGLVGLCEAARRFDPERGVRLGTYAAKAIRASMRRYTLAHRRIVRLPSTRDGRKLLANLRRVQHELTARLGTDPTPQAVADLLGVNVRDVEEMEAALSSKDVSYGPARDGRSFELACDTASAESLFGDAEERMQSIRFLDAALAGLSPRERLILQQRHSANQKATLATIARGIGLSRERVRQIEVQARKKMRDAMITSSCA